MVDLKKKKMSVFLTLFPLLKGSMPKNVWEQVFWANFDDKFY